MVRRRRAWLLVGVILLSILAVGCSKAKVTEDKDRQQVVAEVNGEKITKGEFLDLYNQVKADYGIDEEIEADPEQKEMVQEIKSNVLEQMISEKLILQNAKKAGFTVTEELLNQSRTEFENIISSLEEQLKQEDLISQNDSEQGNDTTTKDYKKDAEEYVANELKNMNMTQEEYINYVAEQMAMEQFVESILKDVHASDEEIEKFYEDQLKSQKGDASSILDAAIQLYELPGRRVKHILVALSDEDQEEYNSLVAAEKEEEAKKFLDEKLKEIEPKAQEALDKAKNGDDFEKLIEEYGQDPGMKDNQEGYIVQQDGQFISEFEEAAFQLEEGGISDLIATSYGYHIIKLYESIPEKVYTLEEKKEEIQAYLDGEKKIETFTSKIDEWAKNATITRYLDLL